MKYCNFFIKFPFFLILFFIYSSTFAQNKFLFSVGISDKWNVSSEKLDTEGTENVISQGGIGYFATLGISWLNKPDVSILTRITYEKFNSELQNWELTPIGSFDANIIRIDPLVWHGPIEKSKFLLDFSFVGLSIFTGTSKLLPNSYCYDNGQWYLIKQMNLKKSIGWNLLGVGIGYQISKHVQISIETFLIEEDSIKVKFLTSTNKTINSSVFSNYGLLPLKFKFTIRI